MRADERRKNKIRNVVLFYNFVVSKLYATRIVDVGKR